MNPTASLRSPQGAKHRRPCPAIDGFIAPPDCGARRGSQLACPATCAFYPFGAASYDAWERVTLSWLEKALNYVRAAVGGERMAARVLSLELPGWSQSEPTRPALELTLNTLLYLDRDPQGQTLGERWEADGYAGLNNDERVMARFRALGFATVIEVRRLLDGRSFLAVDRFEPRQAPFVVQHATRPGAIPRYARMLVWLTHYQYFSALAVDSVDLQPHAWTEWEAGVENGFQAARQTRPELTHRRYVSEHFAELAREHEALRVRGHEARPGLRPGVVVDQAAEAVYADAPEATAGPEAEGASEAGLGHAPPLTPEQEGWLLREGITPPWLLIDAEAGVAAWRAQLHRPSEKLEGRDFPTALADPAFRERALELLRSYLRNLDVQNHRQGTALNLDPLLRELGAEELV